MATPGGAKLRSLREQAGRSQLWVEAEAEIGTGYLQRVESGRVAQPERATVERILDALGVSFQERRTVLELFGYVVATPLPTAEECAWAAEAARRDLDEAPFPAYVLDCAHRLVAWNRFLPCLLGVEAASPVVIRLAGHSMLAPWFVPGSPLGRLVAEPETFLPALVRAFRFEMQYVRGEAWASDLIDGLLESLPRFRTTWEQVERERAPAGPARALVPVKLAVPGVGVLLFRLSAEHFTRDSRFRTVYYFPADRATMLQCATWAESLATR